MLTRPPAPGWGSPAWCRASPRSGGRCRAWTLMRSMTWSAPGRSSAPCQRRPGGGSMAVDGKTLRGSGQWRRACPASAGCPGSCSWSGSGPGGGGGEDERDPDVHARCSTRSTIAGVVITADALHAQRAHATYLIEQRRAHYVFTVKGNQPTLAAQLAARPWRTGPGRPSDRANAATAARRSARSRSLPWPPGWCSRTPPRPSGSSAAAGWQRNGKKWSCETVYAITSLTATQASPAGLAAIIRGHWGIEDRLHWVRDLDLRRGPLPDPHRQRPPDHGQPAQPRHHHLAAGRPRQHRRRPALPRPPARPATADDHEVLNDFAGPWHRLVPHPPGVPAQHRVLVAEHQQFGVLRLVPAEH